MTHQVIGKDDFFKWQGGYGAFTVSKRHVHVVTKYVNNQKRHHSENDLWDEFERTSAPEQIEQRNEE